MVGVTPASIADLYLYYFDWNYFFCLFIPVVLVSSGFYISRPFLIYRFRFIISKFKNRESNNKSFKSY